MSLGFVFLASISYCRVYILQQHKERLISYNKEFRAVQNKDFFRSLLVASEIRRKIAL